MKKDKILVTGGGGFLGKAIVKMLIARGDDVSSFSRNFYPELDKMGVKQLKGDLSDYSAVDNACAGMDIIFHVAAKAGVSGKWKDYFKPNVLGTENIVKASLKNGVERLVYTSSPSVVFDGNNMEGVDESIPYPLKYNAPYPETKAIAEKIVINAAINSSTILNNPSISNISPTSETTKASLINLKPLKSVILRPHLIWGPGDNHLLPGIISRAEKIKRVGDGTNRVDTIYIDNAAYAHILAGDKLKTDPAISGNIYFISQDEPVLLWRMVDDMLDAAGLPPIKGSISLKAAERAGFVIETIFNIFNIKKEPPMTRFMAEELAASHWFNISRAKKDLGYYPIVSTKEGLRRLKNWLKTK